MSSNESLNRLYQPHIRPDCTLNSPGEWIFHPRHINFHMSCGKMFSSRTSAKSAAKLPSVCQKSVVPYKRARRRLIGFVAGCRTKVTHLPYHHIGLMFLILSLSVPNIGSVHTFRRKGFFNSSSLGTRNGNEMKNVRTGDVLSMFRSIGQHLNRFLNMAGKCSRYSSVACRSLCFLCVAL